MDTPKYIGPRKVEVVAEEVMKTFGNNDVVTVRYEGGYSELMPKATFELLVTEIPADFNSLRDKRMKAIYKAIFPLIGELVAVFGEDDEVIALKRTDVLGRILAAISEVDIKDSEIQNMLNQITATLNSVPQGIQYELVTAFYRAINWLWTKDDTQFVPGTNVLQDRTYLETKRINADIPVAVKKEDEQPTEKSAE